MSFLGFSRDGVGTLFFVATLLVNSALCVFNALRDLDFCKVRACDG